MKRRFSWWLRILLSAILVVVVLSFVELRELKESVARMNMQYVLAVLLLIQADRLLMAYKWNRLLAALDVSVPLFSLFRIYSVSSLAGILLPSTVGGDMFRLYSLAQYTGRSENVFASMIVERMIGLVVQLVLTTCSLGLAFYLIGDIAPYFKQVARLIISVTVIALALIGLIRGVFRGNIGKLSARVSNHSLVKRLRQVYEMCWAYQSHPRTTIVVFAWTVLEQMGPLAANILLVRALFINVSLLGLIVTIPIITLATKLPISVDGIGVQEGLYVALLGLVGVSASAAFSLSLLTRVLQLLSALPWGVHYIMRSGRLATSVAASE
jgi:uncharacterized protein (TIRG00374 family)